MRNRMWLLLACGLFFICSCKKDRYTIDDLARSYFTGYNLGSYWVYEDSTGVIDSTWVVGYTAGFEESKNMPGNPPSSSQAYEYCSITVSSTVLGFGYGYEAEATSTGFTKCVCINHENHRFFSVHFKDNNVDTSNIDINAVTQSNYQINQVIYPNVIIIYPPIADSTESYIVIAPGIGIVEHKYGSRIFKLKRYSIKK